MSMEIRAKWRPMTSFSTSESRFSSSQSFFQKSNGTITRGFNIVKAFIELGTRNTVESLQALYADRAQPQN